MDTNITYWDQGSRSVDGRIRASDARLNRNNLGWSRTCIMLLISSLWSPLNVVALEANDSSATSTVHPWIGTTQSCAIPLVLVKVPASRFAQNDVAAGSEQGSFLADPPPIRPQSKLIRTASVRHSKSSTFALSLSPPMMTVSTTRLVICACECTHLGDSQRAHAFSIGCQPVSPHQSRW